MEELSSTTDGYCTARLYAGGGASVTAVWLVWAENDMVKVSVRVLVVVVVAAMVVAGLGGEGCCSSLLAPVVQVLAWTFIHFIVYLMITAETAMLIITTRTTVRATGKTTESSAWKGWGKESRGFKVWGS